MDYGLWLLVGLLIVIALVFLLSGRRKDEVASETPAPPVDRVEAPEAGRVAEAAVTPLTEPTVEPEPAPVAVQPEPAPATAPMAAAESVPAPSSDTVDDLLKLKGVGPKLRTLLIELGVTRYAQIAAWSDADIAAVDARLGSFKGRPVRDQWVDQAKYLAAGDTAGFEAKYGKL